MLSFPPTIILRHRRENLKKCSLAGLENREDLLFFVYPTSQLPSLGNYLLLSLEASTTMPLKPLSSIDAHHGIFLVDGTWRNTKKMMKKLPPLDFRSLPSSIKTAYPRRQPDCPDPSRGLASVEALYVAYLLLGRETRGILENYYWKEAFQAALPFDLCIPE